MYVLIEQLTQAYIKNPNDKKKMSRMLVYIALRK